MQGKKFKVGAFGATLAIGAGLFMATPAQAASVPGDPGHVQLVGVQPGAGCNLSVRVFGQTQYDVKLRRPNGIVVLKGGGGVPANEAKVVTVNFTPTNPNGTGVVVVTVHTFRGKFSFPVGPGCKMTGSKTVNAPWSLAL